MSAPSDEAAKVDLLSHELETLIGYQADRVNSINERIGWLLVFSALNVSTLMVSSFAAFRAQLVGQSDAYEWWLDLFTLDILLYVLSIVFGFLGQRIVIRFADANYDELPFRELMARDPASLKAGLLDIKFAVLQANERLVNQKTRYLNAAYAFLVIAVGLLFVVVLAALVL